MRPVAGLVWVAIGVVAGAAGTVLFGSRVAQRARPVAKQVLKAGLKAAHDARVRGTEVAEGAEDLYAEAKAEATAEIMAAAAAAAQTQAKGSDSSGLREGGPAAPESVRDHG
jgi:hypothetical protein